MVEKDDVSPRSKIAGFLLTLILLPPLFVGTCVPVGLALMSTGSSRSLVPLGFTVYGLVFFGIVIRKAIQTKNLGTRWGIIIIGGALAIAGIISLKSVF